MDTLSNPRGMSLAQHDYLDLWKYFQERADAIKADMFERVTWVLGFASAIVAFAISDLGAYREKAPEFLRLLALLGQVLCIYALVIIRESSRHIQRNWDRAKRCQTHVAELAAIWDGPNAKPNTGEQPLWQRPGFQAGFIVALFMAGFAWALLQPETVIQLVVPTPSAATVP